MANLADKAKKRSGALGRLKKSIVSLWCVEYDK